MIKILSENNFNKECSEKTVLNVLGVLLVMKAYLLNYVITSKTTKYC